MNIANRLTIARIILVPVFIVFFYLGNPSGAWIWNILAAVVFVAAALTDLFDGRLARKRHRYQLREADRPHCGQAAGAAR